MVETVFCLYANLTPFNYSARKHLFEVLERLRRKHEEACARTNWRVKCRLYVKSHQLSLFILINFCAALETMELRIGSGRHNHLQDHQNDIDHH